MPVTYETADGSSKEFRRNMSWIEKLREWVARKHAQGWSLDGTR